MTAGTQTISLDVNGKTERLRLLLYRVAYHFEKCLAGGG